MSVPIWIALGVLVIALGLLGVLLLELFGHVQTVDKAVSMARANLAPKAQRLQPLLALEVRSPLPTVPPRRTMWPDGQPTLPATPQARGSGHQPRHSVEWAGRRQEETT